jgi:hypothetical protein
MGLNPSKSNAGVSVQPLQENELQLLVANTKFSAEQIQKLHYDFQQDCPNGRLEKKDFIRLFSALHPLESKQAKAESYCDYVFRWVFFIDFCYKNLINDKTHVKLF